MKGIFALLALVGCAVGIVYFTQVDFRENVRAVQLDPKKRERYEVYQQGKRILRGKWTGDPKAQFVGWGDDAEVGVQQIKGDVWFATGRVAYTIMAAPKQFPWVVVFNRKTNECLLLLVGPEANEAVTGLRGADWSRVLAEFRGEPRSPRPTKPGEWMWRGQGTALDRK